MSFKIVIHGTSAAIPTANRKLASQFLIYNNSSIFLLDSSEGIQYTFLKTIRKVTKIKAIFISHFHADHVLGLPGFLMTLNMMNYPGPLLIVGPSGLHGHLESISKIYDIKLDYDLKIVEVKDQYVKVFENKQLTCWSFLLDHRVPCVGYVFREKPKLPRLQVEKLQKYQIPPSYYRLLKAGKTVTLMDGTKLCGKDFWGESKPSYSYAFCTDTRPCYKIIDYIRNVDMLYHESTFLHRDIEKAIQSSHSTALEAAQIAKEANVKYLLLGHFSTRYGSIDAFLNEARTIFPNTIIAEEEKILSIPYNDREKRK